MPTVTELLKALLYGITEGITEWLPVSSTGHLILLGEFLPLAISPAFSEAFDVVIQLGAILAVVLLYFHKLNPLSPRKSPLERKQTRRLWLRVCIAVLPSAVAGVLLDDWLDARLYNGFTVAVTLTVYGILFILLESQNTAGKSKSPIRTAASEEIGYRQALLIGLFQMLSLVPGTSRSGATILGAMLVGTSRAAAAEFSFFMAIPTMLGAALVKTAKLFSSGTEIATTEWTILALGCLSAFLVSLCAIRFLMDFVSRHSFAPFGWYRIALGALVLVCSLR
jgi:undecaprenyl-diphosphatase